MANIPNEADQKSYYDSRWSAEVYADRLKLTRCVQILSLLERTKLQHPKILELGCGSGWLTAILGAFGPTKGLELSPKAVEEANARYTHVSYQQVNLAGWKPPEEEHDVVISHEVLEHLENQDEHLEQANGLLRTNGYLILTTPNAKTMYALTQKKRETWTTQPIENWVTRSQLRTLLANNGFTIEYETTCVLGHGTSGIHRLVNSYKFIQVLTALGLGGIYRAFRERADFGLHLVVLARKC